MLNIYCKRKNIIKKFFLACHSHLDVWVVIVIYFSGQFKVCLCVCVSELMFLETSALTGENVEEAFVQCARKILNKIESGRITALLTYITLTPDS